MTNNEAFERGELAFANGSDCVPPSEWSEDEKTSFVKGWEFASAAASEAADCEDAY